MNQIICVHEANKERNGNCKLRKANKTNKTLQQMFIIDNTVDVVNKRR